MGFVAVGAVVLGRFVPLLALENCIVAVKTLDSWFRVVRVGIVAFVTIRIKYGGVNVLAGLLLFMTRFTRGRFLGQYQHTGLKRAVRIVAPAAFVSEDHRVVPAVCEIRVAL